MRAGIGMVSLVDGDGAVRELCADRRRQHGLVVPPQRLVLHPLAGAAARATSAAAFSQPPRDRSDYCKPLTLSLLPNSGEHSHSTCTLNINPM